MSMLGSFGASAVGRSIATFYISQDLMAWSSLMSRAVQLLAWTLALGSMTDAREVPGALLRLAAGAAILIPIVYLCAHHPHHPNILRIWQFIRGYRPNASGGVSDCLPRS